MSEERSRIEGDESKAFTAAAEHDTLPSLEPARSARGRTGVLLIALLVLALMIVGLLASWPSAPPRSAEGDGSRSADSQGGPAGSSGGPALALLDSARAEGKPAYVLIHSLN